MTRITLSWLFSALFRIDVPYSPMRAVEYMLAWLTIAWSAMALAINPLHPVETPVYAYLLVVASMPTWGTLGLIVGVTRLLALVVNGSWRRTPILRFFGAMFGMIWWTMIFGLFWISVRKGSPPFPMLGCYPVLIFFEVYSCFRCGQDANTMCSLSSAPPRSLVAYARRAEHG